MGQHGRGGAALRQPGYIHVLGDGNVSATMNKVKDDPLVQIKPSRDQTARGCQRSHQYLQVHE